MTRLFTYRDKPKHLGRFLGLVSIIALLMQLLAVPIMPRGTAIASHDSTATTTLTVTKVVNGGTMAVGDFDLFVDGMPITSGVATTTLAAGAHVVTETSDPDYAAVFSGDCDSGGNVTLAEGDHLNCTITNTFTGTTTGTTTATTSLMVTKVVVGGTSTPADFQLFVNGMPVTSGVATTTLTPGPYTVTEATSTDYAAVFSGDCDTGGNVDLDEGEELECTITNTFTGTTTGTTTATTSLTVTKVVVGSTSTPADFQLFVNGMPITSGVATTTLATGTIAVTEATSTDFIATFSGDCDVNGMVDLDEGENLNCVITNTFVTDNFCPADHTLTESTGRVVSGTDTIVNGSGASELSFIHPAWTASFGTSSAVWIWADDPVSDPGTTTTETFTRTFFVSGTTSNAVLNIASDNSYRVFVNGDLVASDSSSNNFQLATQDQISLTNAFVNGTNTLAIEVTNDGGTATTTAEENPAGLLFDLSWTSVGCVGTTTPPNTNNGGGGGGGGGNGGGGGGGGSSNNQFTATLNPGIVLGTTSFIPTGVTPIVGAGGQVLGAESFVPGLPATGGQPILPALLTLVALAGVGLTYRRFLS